MVPLQRLPTEEDHREEREDRNRHHLLDYLELHQAEGTAVADVAVAIGRDLEGVLEESQAPAQQDHQIEWCVVGDDPHLLQLDVPVPREGHKDVGGHQ